MDDSFHDGLDQVGVSRPSGGSALKTAFQRFAYACLSFAYQQCRRLKLARLEPYAPRVLRPFAGSPRLLTAEATNRCNANCVFCGYGDFDGAKKEMDFSLFRSVVDQYVAMGGGDLSLTPTVGEALIDPSLDEKIAYARSQSKIAAVSLFTNGILLGRERFDRLVQAGLSHLVISMSGFSKAEYLRLFRRDHFDRVLANLQTLPSSPYFRRIKIAISLRTDTALPYFNPHYIRLRRMGYQFSRPIFYDTWSGRVTNEKLPGYMFIRPETAKPLPCHLLYAGVGVKPDGRIVACSCRDMLGSSDLYLGDAAKDSLRDVWNSSKLQDIRHSFLRGTLPDVCVDCRHYLPVDVRWLGDDPTI